MAVEPTENIEFATGATTATPTDPGSPKKLAGFDVGERPPAHWFNWLFRALWKWVAHFKVRDTEKRSLFADNLAMTMRHAPEANQWNAVAMGESAPRFVAVARNGTNRVMYSADGVAWTAAAAAQANTWRSVCWGSHVSKWVAVSSDGANRVMTSTSTGSSWTAQTAASADSWYSVCYSPALQLFVAVANASSAFMSSPDGITWTARTAPAVKNWTSVCWSPELATFVAVSLNNGANAVATSSDGITWTGVIGAGNVYSVCWSPELSLFVAVGDGFCVYSSNGTSWSLVTSALFGLNWSSVTWAPEMGCFVAVPQTAGANVIAVSKIGTTSWRQVPIAGGSAIWTSVCWSTFFGRFVAVAEGSVNGIMTSGGGTLTAGSIVGTTVADTTTPAGKLGEYISSAVTAIGSFTTGTAKNLTSVSLTAGDWDVSGIATFTAAAITGTQAALSIGATSASYATVGDSRADTSLVPTAGAGVSLTVPNVRISLAATTTVYLVGGITFSAGTPAANARISARRVR